MDPQSEMVYEMRKRPVFVGGEGVPFAQAIDHLAVTQDTFPGDLHIKPYRLITV